MLNLAILMWIMLELGAPSWCFTCWWIAMIFKFLSLCVDLIKIGHDSK